MVFSLLQGSVIPFFFDGVSQPDIWLVAIVVGTMIFPVKFSYALAVIGGLLQDLVIGNFFGMHIFAYAAIMFICIKVVRVKYNRHWYISVLSVIIASVAFIGFSTLIIWLSGIPIMSFLYLIQIGVPFISYNAVGALLLHWLLWYFKDEGESRW